MKRKPIARLKYRFIPWVLVFIFSLLCNTGPVTAFKSDVCDQAADLAAAETGVPISVLWSITRAETGRTKNGELQPWPWTVNMEGKGHWFDTEDAARSYVFKHFKRGARSFDVGCFQINYKWHGTAFRSIDQMFDPFVNARYAAEFLLRLYNETGDWSLAAGAYHSRRPKFADRYKARFEHIRTRHSNVRTAPKIKARENTDPPAKTTLKNQNTYPLLQQAHSTRSKGSLVPLHNNRRHALIDVDRVSEGF